jgi:hypothetical protein
MRTIGIALFLLCVGGAGCTSADGANLGQGQQAEAGNLATCAYFSPSPILCADDQNCVSTPNGPSIEVDGPGICVDKTTTKLVTCGGFGGLKCVSGYICVDDPTDTCDPADGGADCSGVCIKDPTPAPTQCGGFAGLLCPEGLVCVDNPLDGCDPANGGADCGGICVEDTAPAPQFCGGFANIKCPEGLSCIDDPSDDCDPQNGGADCGGICVTP